MPQRSKQARDLSIGEVARASGITPSALRYYERAGLLPAVPRSSRQRRYSRRIFGRLAVIRLALAAGFTIRETRLFLTGFSQETRPAERWRTLAARKLDEVNALMQRAQQMKTLLETSFHCGCPSLEDCEGFFRSPGAPAVAPAE